MNEIKIRLATKEDAELIADLSRSTFYDAFAKDNTKEDMEIFMQDQFTKTSLMKEVTDGDGIFFIAFIENETVGYARLRLNKQEEIPANENSIEIARIYSKQSYIGKGVGRVLMQASLEKAKELKKTFIWLGVWEKNVQAIHFYQRWGFQKFSEHKFLLGTDLQTDWLMKREV